MNPHEELSAWMDGEAGDGRTEAMTKMVLQTPESRARWSEWHLIGDVMRSSALSKPSRVADAVSIALEHEPNHIPLAQHRTVPARVLARRRVTRALSGVAVAAALMFVVFMAVSPQMQEEGGAGQLAAQAPATTVAGSLTENAAVLQDARLRELFDAHGSMSIRPVSTEVR